MKSIRIFIASPGDLNEEREALSNTVVPELRRIFGNPQMMGSKREVSIEAIRWETHSWPAVGQDAQDVINRQIGPYDILVGMMWKRFGTPTKRSSSGTGEEFQKAYEYYKAYKRPHIMFYFRTSPFYTKDAAEIRQFQKVINFRKKLESLGVLFWEFTSPLQFERVVREHLIRQIAQIVKVPLRASEDSVPRAKGNTSDANVTRGAAKIFFTYSRDDLSLVKPIYQLLREAGFEVWLDVEQLIPGQQWRHEIDRAISESDVILVFLSERATRRLSFFHVELNTALDLSRKKRHDRPFLIPVRLDPIADVPESLRQIQWIDYFAEDGPEKLIAALRLSTSER